MLVKGREELTLMSKIKVVVVSLYRKAVKFYDSFTPRYRYPRKKRLIFPKWYELHQTNTLRPVKEEETTEEFHVGYTEEQLDEMLRIYGLNTPEEETAVKVPKRVYGTLKKDKE